MKYLGTISGNGVLLHKGKEIAGASYELEGYVRRAGSVTGSGEIELTPAALRTVIRKSGLKLLTGNNHLLDIKFVDKKVSADTYIHVDVAGDLPVEDAWLH